MEYRIRAAGVQDLDGLCTIRNNEGLFRKYLAQQENGEVSLIIAEDDSTVIMGFQLLKLGGSLIPKLSDLYVKEACRGKGVGSDLIKYHENMAKDLGFEGLFVSVDSQGNPKMIQLITKLGYEAVSEPYTKHAIFYNEDGTPYETTYTRIDLKKLLK